MSAKFCVDVSVITCNVKGILGACNGSIRAHILNFMINYGYFPKLQLSAVPKSLYSTMNESMKQAQQLINIIWTEERENAV